MSGQEKVIESNNGGKILEHVTIPRDKPAQSKYLTNFGSAMEKKLEKEKFVNNKQAADDRIAIIVISSISTNLFKRNIIWGVQKREFLKFTGKSFHSQLWQVWKMKATFSINPTPVKSYFEPLKTATSR